MKKLMILAGALALGLAANADCWWSTWVGDKNYDKELEGCQIGLACECKQMKGAQVAIFWNRAETFKGGCQFAFGYCNVGKFFNGPQVSVVNIAREGSALQFGLLNWNKKGFLPFFPFFNFATTMFGSTDR